MSDTRKNIAVIGSGAAGITAAWLLQRKHDVVLFEKDTRLGGHTNTIVIEDGPDAGTPVDTGFIVFNDRNYPTLQRILGQLGCAGRNSDMSFGFHSKTTGLAYCASDLNGLLAQRANALRPSYWWMWREVFRFFQIARRELAAGQLAGKTMGEFLHEAGIGSAAVRQFILPMGAAIWSAPQQGMLEFPAESLMRFWENHGLLSATDHPQWRTVIGGSHTYVQRMARDISRIVTGAKVAGIRRETSGIHLDFGPAGNERFDTIVVATHADQALRLLADPSPDEQRLLGAWTYARNRTILHTDESFMPENRRAWASWNYVEESLPGGGQPVPVTYWMNRLQGLQTTRQYFVTLNPSRPVPRSHLIRSIEYEHPQYTFAALGSQQALASLNGQRNTFFCGSYFGYGFHEDAMKSAVAVAAQLGVDL